MTFEVEQAFHGDLVEGIYAAAEPAGYEVVLSPIAPARRKNGPIDDVLDDRCEAVILLGPRPRPGRSTALAAKLPVVTIARHVRSSAVDCVRTDDRSGMNSAVNQGTRLALGHRFIAYLDGGRTPGAPERLRRIQRAAAAHWPR